MSKVTFVYKGNDFVVHCNKNEKLSSIINTYYNKSLIPRNTVYFLCNGDLLDEEMTEDKIPISEDNKKKILVYDYNEKGKDEIIKSNEVICKTCKESSRIDINNYTITLFGCKNGHRITNIKFSDFNQTQLINISKIYCDFCKTKNISDSYNKLFYRCLTCKKNICIVCKEKHSSEHNIINYDQKNYICEEHGEYYHSYCYECDKNMCTSCEKIHKNHATESFGSLIRDRSGLIHESEKLRMYIDELNHTISEIIKKLNKVRENFEIYYEIHKNIITNNNKFRNFEVLYNINEMSNNIVTKNLEKIIKDNNINNRINSLLNIYDKMEMEPSNDGETSRGNKEDKIFFYEPETESKINENQTPQPKTQIFTSNNTNNKNIFNKSNSQVIQKPDNKKEEENKKSKSGMIELVNELKNALLEEVINKSPLISELIDIKELLKKYKEDSPEINIVKVITSKYAKYREVRQNGSSFYTCFMYRLFEYVSESRNQELFDKIGTKILNSQDLIKKNGYDWDFVKEAHTLFLKEFMACFQAFILNLKDGRIYLDKVFKSEQSFNYFNLFIHICVAAYVKENRILFENYIDQDFDSWILKVEEIGLESSQIEILALANFFDVGVKIEYLYPTKVDTAKFPENKKGEDIFINILFRPDHYDLLYK